MRSFLIALTLLENRAADFSETLARTTKASLLIASL